MRVIDLLNKIANGEKLPEKIKVMGGTYYLCEGDLSGCYYFSEKQGFGGVKLSFDTSVMNEEVEISESVEEIYKRRDSGLSLPTAKTLFSPIIFPSSVSTGSLAYMAGFALLAP